MTERILRSDIPMCRWPSGWEGNLRHAVTDNIIENESRTHVILVWRAEGELGGGKWALIGGYIDHDHTAEQTARAESSQEAGQRHIGSIALFRIVDNPHRHNETSANVSLVFASTVPDPEVYGDIEIADPDGGIQRARWFDLNVLPPAEEMAFDHHQILTAFREDPTTYPMSIFMSA